MSQAIATVDLVPNAGRMIHIDSREEFYSACNLLHDGSLHAAFRRLTSIVDGAEKDRSLKKSGLWALAKCRQRMALVAKTLEETISLQREALLDRAEAIRTDPQWFAHEMLGHRWYPQHPVYMPAYLRMLGSNSLSIKWAAPEFVETLGEMGSEAAEAIPALHAALEKWPDVTQIETAIQRIIEPTAPVVHSPIGSTAPPLVEMVAEALSTYPGRDGSNGTPCIPSEDLIDWTEKELCQLLDDEQEKIRELAACVSRFTLEKPRTATLSKLMQHAGADEERARVRGQCLLTLSHYATVGALSSNDLEKLLALFQDRLTDDAAVSVQSIAAESLVKVGKNRVDVVGSLVSMLAVSSNPSLTWALVRAMAECGHAAREALPQVLNVRPRLGNSLDDVTQATAILYMAAEESREHKDALSTILAAVRWQPTNQPTRLSRERRQAALNTICEAPVNEMVRCRFLVERYFLDESATLRRIAGQKLTALDDELAKNLGVGQTIGAPLASMQ
jgi:hypothetical protein